MDKCAAPTGGGKGRSYDYCYWHDLRNEREVYGATWVEGLLLLLLGLLLRGCWCCWKKLAAGKRRS